MSRNLTILLFTLFTFSTLSFGQKKFKAANAKRINFLNFYAQITIEGYSGDEILIFPQGINKNDTLLPGVKAFYPHGTDNTGLGLGVETKDDEVTFKYLLPKNRLKSFVIKVPKEVAVRFTSNCELRTDVSLSNLSGEIEVESCFGIIVKDVTGSLILASKEGNISIYLNELKEINKYSIANITGDIDLFLPPSLKATFSVYSSNWVVQSDLDLKNNFDSQVNSNLKQPYNLHLNGGGQTISLKNIDGNIEIHSFTK